MFIRMWRDHLGPDQFRDVLRIENIEFEGKTSGGSRYQDTLETILEIDQLANSRGWSKSQTVTIVREPEVTSGFLDGKALTKEQLAEMTDGMKSVITESLQSADSGQLTFDILSREGIEVGEIYDAPQLDIARLFVIAERRNALAVAQDKRTGRQDFFADLDETQLDEAARTVCETWPQTYYCQAKLTYQLVQAEGAGTTERWNFIANLVTGSSKTPVKLRVSTEVDRHLCIQKASLLNETPTQPDSRTLLNVELRLD